MHHSMGMGKQKSQVGRFSKCKAVANPDVNIQGKFAKLDASKMAPFLRNTSYIFNVN